jgi:hypothetical protein
MSSLLAVSIPEEITDAHRPLVEMIFRRKNKFQAVMVSGLQLRKCQKLSLRNTA